MPRFQELLDLCRGRHVYIQTHNFPDPDAIASAFGLQRLLALWDIPSTLCYDGKLDKLSASRMLEAFHIEMYAYEDLRPRLREEDYILCVDAQKHSGNITDFVGEEVACIDHHPVAVPMSYLYRDIRPTGACATIIAQYYREMGREPDRNTATALLYGLKIDTLQFTRGVTEEDIAMFHFLFPFSDSEALSRMERNNLEFSDLKAYGAAIEGIELYGALGLSSIPFPCPDALIAILSDFLLALQEVEVAAVFSRREDGIKFSVRSEDPAVHAGELIRKALEGLGSGGGHREMAGGLIPRENVPRLGAYPRDAIRQRLLDALPHRAETR